MSIDAMKLALEALEDVQEAYGNHSKWFKDRVDALRQAIGQAEQKPCLKGGQCKHGSWCSEVYCQEHCEFVEQAEQAQPVAWWNPKKDAVSCDPVHRHHPDCVPLYTTPPPRQPLPPQSPCEMTPAERKMFRLGWLECEAAHGIGDKA